MITIQKIETNWTKKSRGMPNAQLRNAVPRALKLPPLDQDIKILVHEVTADECHDFALNHQTITIEKANQYWSFKFEENDDTLKIFFIYDYHQHGLPHRSANYKKIIQLATGETASLHINGRFVSYNGQWYKQYFINIGYDIIDPNIFISQPFNHHVNKMEDLF